MYSQVPLAHTDDPACLCDDEVDRNQAVDPDEHNIDPEVVIGELELVRVVVRIVGRMTGTRKQCAVQGLGGTIRPFARFRSDRLMDGVGNGQREEQEECEVFDCHLEECEELRMLVAGPRKPML